MHLHLLYFGAFLILYGASSHLLVCSSLVLTIMTFFDSLNSHLGHVVGGGICVYAFLLFVHAFSLLWYGLCSGFLF